MTTSWEGTSRWPGVVLGKIKSLWSTSQGTASDGLNQLIDPPTKDDRLTRLVTPTRKVTDVAASQQFASNRGATGRIIYSSCGFFYFTHPTLFSFCLFFFNTFTSTSMKINHPSSCCLFYIYFYRE